MIKFFFDRIVFMKDHIHQYSYHYDVKLSTLSDRNDTHQGKRVCEK